MSTQHVRRDGTARDPTLESVMRALSALQTSMSSMQASMQASLGRIEGDLGEVKTDLSMVQKDMSMVQKDMLMLSDRVERQERRLASIESFPMPPMNRPARLYATESHSVSLPRRVPIGYAG